MNKCYHCNKGVLFGRSHTHHRGVAGGRWKKRAPKTRRIFKPNLQKITILENNKEKQVKICNKCLKRIKKDLNEGRKSFLKLAHPEIYLKEKDKNDQKVDKDKRKNKKSSSK